MSILELNNIVKRDGDNIVLDGIYLDIEEKGIYAILGKNAAEKTALAEVLAGCATIDEGAMFYRGISVYSSNKNNCDAKLKIGYVPKQNFFFEDMTVYDILDFTGRLRGVSSNKRARQIKESLELVNLSSKYDVFVRELTAAEKKKLSIANSLIGNPSMIVFDEPIESVLTNDAEIIKEVIRMVGSKKVIILLTDNVRLAQEMAMHVGVVYNGEITLWDYMENLKERYADNENFLIRAFDEFSVEA